MFVFSHSSCSPQELYWPANRGITKHCVCLSLTARDCQKVKLKSEPCVCVSLQGLSRSTAVDIVNSSKILQQETKMLLEGKLLVRDVTVNLFLSLACSGSDPDWCMIMICTVCVAVGDLAERGASFHGGQSQRRVTQVGGYSLDLSQHALFWRGVLFFFS